MGLGVQSQALVTGKCHMSAVSRAGLRAAIWRCSPMSMFCQAAGSDEFAWHRGSCRDAYGFAVNSVDGSSEASFLTCDWDLGTLLLSNFFVRQRHLRMAGTPLVVHGSQ